MLDTLISVADKETALSDIHLYADGEVWCRLDGVLRQLEMTTTLEDIYKVCLKSTRFKSKEDFEKELGRRGDVDFAVNLGQFRYRCNVYRYNEGSLGLAARKLSPVIPELHELGLPDTVLAMADKSKGLFLVTGATGTGKTTTLFSIVNHINRIRQGHILTIEDPIEYVLRSENCRVTQREVGINKDSKDFSTALRGALRQDPDIIVVGELRDKETIQTALDASETGHLVLSTLHTVNARQTIDRITSFFAGDEKEWAQSVLSTVLIGIVSQTLVEGASGSGRFLACEAMPNTSSTRQAIKEGKIGQIFSIMETGSKQGHLLLNSSLLNLVAEGKITAENARYHSYDPAGIDKELGDDKD